MTAPAKNVVAQPSVTEGAKPLHELLDDLRQRAHAPPKDDALLREAAEALRNAEKKINTPEIHDFAEGVVLESAHQRERWGTNHDGGKAAADWFWLIGYLAGKALHAQTDGRTDKALHHIITTAAALCNWHASLLGQTNMRPGIEPPALSTAKPAE